MIPFFVVVSFRIVHKQRFSFPINSVPQGSLNDIKRSALGAHSVPFPEFIDPFTGGRNHIDMISTLLVSSIIRSLA